VIRLAAAESEPLVTRGAPGSESRRRPHTGSDPAKPDLSSVASAKEERSVWWPLAVVIRTHFDKDFARIAHDGQLLRRDDVPGSASRVV
jgi:hypothetical protein